MALRSGYKGVKKLAAGLKWNRPGVLAADDLALANVFFPRSEQAVLGARNSLYVPNKTVTDSDIEMIATDGELSITGQNSGSSAMWVTFSPVSVPKGSFKFKVSGLTANGVTNMQLQTSSGTTVFTVNFEEPEVIGDISASADNYKLFIRLAAGADLSAAKVFPQLLQPSDNLNVNSPYAMTNKEITDKLTVKTLSPTYEQEFTFGVETRAEYVGGIVNIVFSLSEASIPINTTKKLMTLPAGYKPSATQHGMAFVKDASNPVIRLFVDTSRQVSIVSHFAAIENKDIYGSISFVKA